MNLLDVNKKMRRKEGQKNSIWQINYVRVNICWYLLGCLTKLSQHNYIKSFYMIIYDKLWKEAFLHSMIDWYIDTDTILFFFSTPLYIKFNTFLSFREFIPLNYLLFYSSFMYVSSSHIYLCFFLMHEGILENINIVVYELHKINIL